MYATNYLENQFLNVFRGTTLTAPSKVYLGLFLSNPDETGNSGLEVNYTGYQRMEIKFGSPQKSGTMTAISVVEDIKFAQANRAVGTITHIGVFDNKTGGNALAYGELTEELIIDSGESPAIFQDDLKIYMSGSDGLSDSYRQKLLNVFRGQSISGITPYVALFTGDSDNNGVELSGDSYSRTKIDFSAPEQLETGQGMIKNTKKIQFPKPTSVWGVWGNTVIMDAASNGEVVMKKSQDTKEIKKGYIPYFEIGEFQVMIN